MNIFPMTEEYTPFDLAEKARRTLSDAGLVVEEVDLSGELVTCGTTKKPCGTDGRYAVHLDFPPNVWLVNYHEGGEGRTVPLYDRGTLDAMTAGEKEAMRERIRQEKEAARARREEERRGSAEKANRLFPTLSPAGDNNPYLKRKGCISLGDMRQDKDGRLVLPVWNADGRIVSLQFIDGESNKRFLKGGEKAGGYFPIPAKDGGKGGPLLVGEGCATVLSACMATGYAGLVAFDAGNLEAVGRMARTRYADRVLVFLADNDCTDKDGNSRPADKNTGVVAATTAARAVGGKLAVCPAIRGRKADFNDLFTATDDGPERVRVVIEKAQEEKARTSLPAGYFYDRKDGSLMYERRDAKGEVVGQFKVCAHVEVVGRTFGAGKWGVLMEWKDRRGDLRRLSIPARLFQQQGTVWAEMLADEGLDIEAGQ